MSVDIQEMRRIIGASAQGPVEFVGPGCGGGENYGIRTPDGRIFHSVGCWNADRPNALALVYARNALPSVLDEIEALRAELATVQKAHTLVCASLETIQDEQVAPLQAENCRLAAELAAAQKQRDRLLRKARAAQAGLDHGAQCVIPCQDCVCDCPGAGKVKPGRELRATTVAAEIANKGR